MHDDIARLPWRHPQQRGNDVGQQRAKQRRAVRPEREQREVRGDNGGGRLRKSLCTKLLDSHICQVCLCKVRRKPAPQHSFRSTCYSGDSRQAAAIRHSPFRTKCRALTKSRAANPAPHSPAQLGVDHARVQRMDRHIGPLQLLSKFHGPDDHGQLALT